MNKADNDFGLKEINVKDYKLKKNNFKFIKWFDILNNDFEMILAYEPVWAIGTGKSATSEMVAETHASIRNILTDLNVSDNISLLYGGSVSPENASQLSEVPDVDGFLIGGASLDVEKFYSIYLDL